MKKIVALIIAVLSMTVLGDFAVSSDDNGSTASFNEPVDIRVIDYYSFTRSGGLSYSSHIENLLANKFCIIARTNDAVYINHTAISNDFVVSCIPKIYNNSYIWSSYIIPYVSPSRIYIYDSYLDRHRRVLFKRPNSDKWLDQNNKEYNDFIDDLKLKEYMLAMSMSSRDPDDADANNIFTKYDPNYIEICITNTVENVINKEITNIVYKTSYETVYETVYETNTVNEVVNITNFVTETILNVSNIVNTATVFVTNSVINISNLVNIVDKYVTNTIDILNVVTDRVENVLYVTNVVTNVQTNYIDISSTEHIQDSNVGKNRVMQLESGFDGSTARKHIGLAYDEYGFACGIVSISTAKATAKGVRVSGTVYLDSGKSYTVSAVTGIPENGVLTVDTKFGALGNGTLSIGSNGVSAVIGNIEVVPADLDVDSGVLKGSLTLRYFEPDNTVKTRTISITGMILDGEFLIDTADKKSGTKNFYGEIVE